jgi:hypothetical protein
MSILKELNDILSTAGFKVETGVFKEKPDDKYIVLTPLADTYGIHADDRPVNDVQEVRLSLFTKGNYMAGKKTVTQVLLDSGFTVTDRRYVDYEEDTGYFHYAIDVAKNYGLEE